MSRIGRQPVPVPDNVKVTLNGVAIVDAQTDHAALAGRSKGPLGFKGHGAHVEFRNLRIKELPESKPHDASL